MSIINHVGRLMMPLFTDPYCRPPHGTPVTSATPQARMLASIVLWERVRALVLGSFAALWLGSLTALLLGGLTDVRLEAAETPPQAAPVSQDRIAQLIEELGHDDFFVRQNAHEALVRIGLIAFDALSEAEHHRDTEIANRAAYLLRLLKVNWVQSDDPPDVRNLLEQYLGARSERRAQQIEAMASLSNDRGVPALCRVVRFDRTHVDSKRAALAIMEQIIVDDERSQTRQQLILAGIGDSPRTGARWLRSYVAAEGSGREALKTWAEICTAELSVYSEAPNQTDTDVLFRLLRRYVVYLRQWGEADESLAMMRQMLLLNPENVEKLEELVGWLVDQQAWTVVDEAAEMYRQQFEMRPMLLYAQAQAAQGQGDTQRTAKLTRQALQLNRHAPYEHLVTGFRLQQCGQLAWAEAEYRLAAESDTVINPLTLQAEVMLAELFHDQEKSQAAAEVLDELVARVEADKNTGRYLDLGEMTLEGLKVRRHYFHARSHAATDSAAQRKHLLAGLEDDPHDVELLIELHQLPGLEAELRERVSQLVRESTDKLRGAIRTNPAASEHYNQLAWLIANTEGDFHEALRSSQRSLEISPSRPGYLDTLARCHYALGEVAEAIKVQREAVAKEPHSGQMRRQLAFFEQAQQAQQQNKP